MLDSVGRRFKQRRTDYWSCNWSFNEEACCIPQDMCRDYAGQMGSTRKRLAWKLAAKATEETISNIFPLSNKAEILPCPGLEECMNIGTTEFNRCGMLLCIRALKEIEQIFYSRTRSVPGPNTVYMYNARILKSLHHSAVWRMH